MRWFVGSAVTLLLVWGFYTASPYWALWDFSTAVARADANALARRVNFRAVRLSLARQVVGEGLAAKAGGDPVGGADAQLLASTVAVAADPFLEQLVTPEGVRGLLLELNPEIVRTAPEDGSSRIGLSALGPLFETIRTARWRGFRNVYFILPPDARVGAQVRVQVRLSRLTWRIVSIDLPPKARQRIVADMMRRHAAPRLR